jgi:hypothetical protein
MKDFDNGITGPIDYTDPGDRRGLKTIKVMQFTKGKWGTLTDWRKTPVITPEELIWCPAGTPPQKFK